MEKYVIVDLEMCRVPKGIKRKRFGFGNELIQIGAVLLDESLNIIDTYMTYVHPEFGFIDKYIENLTGITKDDVKNAPCASTAISEFINWIPEGAVIVSWSDNDLLQLQAEINGKQIEIPGIDVLFENWIDCQQTFSEKMGNDDRQYKLCEALNITAINYDDGAHDALVDAKNTALLFRKMKTEPVLKLSSYYVSSDKVERMTYNPFAELLANFNAAS